MKRGCVKDLTGQRFGRLVAIRNIAPKGGARWLCACDCGNSHEVFSSHLVRGLIRSCGCFRNEFHVKHGHTRRGETRGLYKAWSSMVQRCTNPRNDRWHRYGGRGITVCDRWKVYENFLADMGERPLGHSLDRRDNSRGYEPDNCYWATPKQQSNNMCRNRTIEHNGQQRTLTEWAREFGLRPGTLTGRLNKGWTIDRALTTPLNLTRRRSRPAADCAHRGYLADIEREEALEVVS